MASVTVPASSTLPVAGADIIAAPLNGWITNIKDFVEGANIDENNVDYSSIDGIVVKQQTQTITGAKTFSASITASAGMTSGGNLISDTDSTDNLGTTSVRWANLYVDSIGDTGQALTITAGTNAITLTAGDVTLYDDNNNADTSISVGTSATERVGIAVLNGAANKTAEEVRFTSYTASATADHGKFTFYVDESGSAIFNIDDGGVDVTGAQTISSTLDVTGLTTATGGITSGGNIISDTDSTDDLGTTSVRWANVYTDSIGDTGQALTITAGANNINATAGTLALTGAQTVSSTLGVTGLITATAGVTSGSNIVSDTDSTDDLGTSSVRWANVYTDSVGDTGQTLNLVGDATGIRVNANIVSDTDSTDDLGTASVRWANVYTDSIGDTGQDLTVAATTVNLPSGHIFDYNGADVTITHSANTLTLAGGTLTGTINPDASSVLADGVTATTQPANDNSTKIATTAYADASGGVGAAFSEFLLIGA